MSYLAKYVTEADGSLPGRSFRAQTEAFLNDLGDRTIQAATDAGAAGLAAQNAADSASKAESAATRAEARAEQVGEQAAQALSIADAAKQTADGALGKAGQVEAVANSAVDTAREASGLGQHAVMIAGDAAAQAQNAATVADQAVDRADMAEHAADRAAQKAEEALSRTLGGVLPWSENMDYQVPCLVFGEGNVLYEALQASGPNTVSETEEVPPVEEISPEEPEDAEVSDGSDGEVESPEEFTMAGSKVPHENPDYWKVFLPAVDWGAITDKPASYPAADALATVLPVTQGGTGSTTAAAARTALGIPAIPAAIAPRPQAAAGVGQFRHVYVGTDGSQNLPAGGTWAWWGGSAASGMGFWALSTAKAGVSAGGAETNCNFIICWRIS